MNLNYKELLDESFAEDSRVWVYQCSRVFMLSEVFEVEDMLNAFTAIWKSHGATVKGKAYLFFGQFIILMADEKATGVSGCSTDSSVRLIKEIESRFQVNMFDRTTLAFVVKEKIQLLPLSQLRYAADNQFVHVDTLYFNNLVQTKKELEENWIIPIKDSWLAKKFTNSQI
jgi:hypothetical protein